MHLVPCRKVKYLSSRFYIVFSLANHMLPIKWLEGSTGSEFRRGFFGTPFGWFSAGVSLGRIAPNEHGTQKAPGPLVLDSKANGDSSKWL